MLTTITVKRYYFDLFMKSNNNLIKKLVHILKVNTFKLFLVFNLINFKANKKFISLNSINILLNSS